MLNGSKLIGFVATMRPKLAKEFYRDILGLSLTEENPFALVFGSNGIMVRVQKVQDHSPAQHTVLGWEVDDITSAIRKLSEQGVRFERYEQLTQDALGIWITPNGSKVAWFKDPDGNILSLTEFAPHQ